MNFRSDIPTGMAQTNNNNNMNTPESKLSDLHTLLTPKTKWPNFLDLAYRMGTNIEK